MRCEEHGLAAGPGGECVVCLREVRERVSRRARRWGVVFFGLVALTCAGLLVAHGLQRRAVPELRLAAHAARPAALLPPAVEESSAVAAAAEPPPAEARPVDLLPADAPLAGEPAPAGSAIAPALSAAPVASGGRAANARVPSKRELQAALQATPVAMFSTSWCRHCQRARRFFQAYGLSVVDRDIDADAQAAAELQRRSGGKAVPLIDVDGQELRGFEPEATMAAVVASVERRLGITGVKLSVVSASP